MDMHLNDPLVSVVMPVFNGGKYLRTAISSILNQTYKNFEFIIINDGSTDDTHSIISNYKDKRIKYINNQDNLRLVRSLNIGIQHASGKYVARMDADDISLPKRIEKQVNFLESHEDCGVLGTCARVIDSSGTKGRYIKRKTDDDTIKWRFLFTNEFTHPTIMMRKDTLLNIGSYNSVDAEDLDLWERLLHITNFSNLRECLVLYRIHTSARYIQSSQTINAESYKIFKRYRENVLGRDLSAGHSSLIDTFFRKEKFKSTEEFKEAIKISTELFNNYLLLNNNKKIRYDYAHTLLYSAEKNKALDSLLSTELVKNSICLNPFFFLQLYPAVKVLKYFMK